MNARPVFELELPEQTPSNNDVKEMHFHTYTKEREKWRKLVLAALHGQIPATPLERVRIEVDRYCAGSLDWDNVYGGLKPMMDCLTSTGKSGLGLIRDDNVKVIPAAPLVRQLKAKQKQGRTVVRIYDASNDDKFKNDKNDNND